MVKRIDAAFYSGNFDYRYGDGQYEIYNSNSSHSITFSDINTANAGNILKFSTTNGKDLIITRTDSKKDKIVLKGWFENYENNLNKFKFMDSDNAYKTQMEIGDVYVSGKGIIYDTKSDDVITGSKKSDKIYSIYGSDTVIAGKGNDYIEFNSDVTNKIVMQKGDGSDTVKINNPSSSVYIQFKGDVDISYTKDKNNLIISGKHVGKKSKTETVTVENYFTDEGKIGSLKNIYVSDDIENITVKNSALNALNIKNEKYYEFGIGTVYSFSGTDYDDIFTAINNKFNAIDTGNGNNIVITGKKGFNIIDGGLGDDNYIVNSLAALNMISDEAGVDALDLKGVGRNDLYLITDVQTSLYDSTDLVLLTNNKGANKLKNFKIKSSDNEISIFKRNINGVVFDLNSSNMDIENINIVNRGNVEIVQGIDDALSVLDNNVRGYLRSLVDSYGNYKYDSALDLLVFGNKKERNALVNLYKNVRIGTDGNNSYTVKSSKTYIASGEGSDSFTFKGKFGDTVINSVTDLSTKDKITIKNYAVEKENLSLYLSDNNEDLIFTASEWNKKTKTTDIHTVTYKNFQTTNNVLTLKDSKREYEVSYTKSGLNKDWSNEKTNHIVYSYGSGEVLVNLSKGYNDIEVNQGNDIVQNQYFYYGGHDIINSYSTKSSDVYNVNLFDKNTDLFIFDNGGNDSLNINGDLTKIRLFMNINKNKDVITIDGNSEHMNWFITDKSNISIKSVKNGLNGIEISGQTNCIETINVGETNINMDEWIDGLRYNVGSWLSTYKNGKYDDAMSVISSGNKSDISALIAKYNEVDYNSAHDYANMM